MFRPHPPRELETPVDLSLQVVVLHEPPEAAHRDHEAVGYGETDAVPHLAEAGHLAAHVVGARGGDVAKGQHQVPARRPRLGTEEGVDAVLDRAEAIPERGVLPGRQVVQMADHLPDMGRHSGAARAYEGDPEGARSAQRLLDLGHDRQSTLVGLQQQAKAVVAGGEGDAQLLGLGLR